MGLLSRVQPQGKKLFSFRKFFSTIHSLSQGFLNLSLIGLCASCAWVVTSLTLSQRCNALLEQLWILLLLHHEPQDKIKSFTRHPGENIREGDKTFRHPKSFFSQGEIDYQDNRGKCPGREKKTFRGPKSFFSTRWDCQFGSLPVFFCGTLLGVGSLDPLQGVRCLGCSFRSPPGVRCLGCSLDPLQGVMCDPQHGALGGRLRGFTAARLKCVKKNFLGPEKFFSFLACWLASGDRK